VIFCFSAATYRSEDSIFQVLLILGFNRPKKVGNLEMPKLYSKFGQQQTDS